jgi:hypothetical protein
VRHPLATDHKLVVDCVSEGIAHPAMVPGEADTALDRLDEIGQRLLLDLAHRVDRDDQAQLVDRRIGEHREIGLDPHRIAVLVQPAPIDCGAFLGVMPIPPTPDDQGTPHSRLPA